MSRNDLENVFRDAVRAVRDMDDHTRRQALNAGLLDRMFDDREPSAKVANEQVPGDSKVLSR